MPVGTKGAMKGLLSDTLTSLIDCEIMLSNNYHLFLTTGGKILQQQRGCHNFMRWNNNLLTDSGGLQIVSLDAQNTIHEEGVSFHSHIDG